MRTALDLSEITQADRSAVGGKACALARMVAEGLPVPRAICVTTDVYDRFLDATGLRGRILMEYHRKPFEQMRWEEMWDAALRIQSMFLNTALPADLRGDLLAAIERRFRERPVAVRSSAVGEDSAQASFAGLHESYVNVRGIDAIIEHVRLVWASTWSDAAMLYRKEIGLDIARSCMAVIVQELVCGERSGIVFGRSPNDSGQAVIEAVYGLNQGLVDGTIEPDRWVLDRHSRRVVSATPARREKMIAPDEAGTRAVGVSAARRRRPPLSPQDVADVFRLAERLENVFRAPQDVEWTFRRGRLFVLQSRPITTPVSSADDDRQWYLSLRPSLETLRHLRRRVEDVLIPEMIAAGEELAAVDVRDMTDRDLAGEIRRRSAVYERWKQIYWDQFIPFAHGFRLFGQVYNRMLRPDDPYEFIELLASGSLVSMARNRRLAELAGMIRRNPDLARTIQDGRPCPDERFQAAFAAFLKDFESPFLHGSSEATGLLSVLVQMAQTAEPKARKTPRRRGSLERRFLDAFPAERRDSARELLDLARASYKLRDDDNIYLGRLETQLTRALKAAARHSSRIARLKPSAEDADEIARALLDPEYAPRPVRGGDVRRPGVVVRARQLLGPVSYTHLRAHET